jgi:hypothetical protein
MPDTYLKGKLVFPAHAAKLVHEVEHCPHGFLRQAFHAHEPSDPDFSEAGYGAWPNSVEITHGWSFG